MIAKVERMSDSPDHRPDVRISDTDRDRAAEVLREIRIVGVAVMGGIEVKRAPARRSSQGELPSPG